MANHRQWFIGALLLLAAVALALIVVPQRGHTPHAGYQPETDWSKTRAKWQRDAVSSVGRILVDREEAFPAAVAMIRSAKREVLVSMYLLGGFERQTGGVGIGKQVVDALVERQEAGVVVRVIHWGSESHPDLRDPPRSFDPWYEPIYSDAIGRGLVVLKPGGGHSDGHIDHTKYFVIDGTVALIGGMNYAEAVGSNHDVMLAVAGPLAVQIRALFSKSWSRAAAAQLALGDPRRALATPPDGQTTDEAHQAALNEAWPPLQAQLLATLPGQTSISDALHDHLASLVAGDELRVSMLHFSDRGMMNAVIDAHTRGVRVRVMLDPDTAFFGVDCGGALNFPVLSGLLAAGVEARRFDAAPGQELHMKLMLIRKTTGDAVVALGSANWSPDGLVGNHEANVFLESESIAKKLEVMFDEDWDAHSRQVDPERLAEFRTESGAQRMMEVCRQRLGLSWRGLTRESRR